MRFLIASGKAFWNMRKSAADNGISGMSLDEINAMS